MTSPLFGDPSILGLGRPGEDRGDMLGDALEELRRDPAQVDPLRRLFDPEFRDISWEYEGSRLDSPMLPGKLHPKQIVALEQKRRFTWLFWGNQVGKTTLGAVITVLYCLGRHPIKRWEAPVTFWASALTWELWQDILLPELLTWIPKDRIIRAPEPYRQSNNRTIEFRADNGKVSRITGKAAEQGAARYQSKRLHGAWLDEEHPEAVFDELQPRLLRFNGVLINTMTPLKGLTWVYHRIYLPVTQGKPQAEDNFVSHAGLADNPSIQPSAIEAMQRMLRHNPAQLAARMYGVFVKPSGRVLKFEEDRNLVKLKRAEAEVIMRQRRCRVFGGVDFGAWRFAFVLIMVDDAGRLYLLDEEFIQSGQYRDMVDAKGVITKKGRARRIHELVSEWGVSPEQWMGIADCANPQDIVELNSAMLADDLRSPYVFGAVHANNKIILAGVDRINGLLGEGLFVVREGIGADKGTEGDPYVWFVGRKSDSDGHPVDGSRWRWEVDNWMYEKGKAEKAQEDKPDDNSADGADMMAATRYVVMTYTQGDGPPLERKHPTTLQREAASQRGEPEPELEPEFKDAEYFDSLNED